MAWAALVVLGVTVGAGAAATASDDSARAGAPDVIMESPRRIMTVVRPKNDGWSIE
jgi:hypothetical protein